MSDRSRPSTQDTLDPAGKVKKRPVAPQGSVQLKADRKVRAGQAHRKADTRQTYTARRQGVVRQSEVADFPPCDPEARLPLDQRRRARRRRLQDGMRPPGNERLV